MIGTTKLNSRVSFTMLVVAGMLVSGMFLRASVAFAAPQRTSESQLTLDWFDQMDAFYAAHPEYKTMPGGGWNPFQRLKWFTLARMENGELPAPDARYKAWQVRRERQQHVSPRATWFTLGPTNFAGRILAIEFDPTNASIAYAGAADGGLWKTTDGGTTWVPLTDEFQTLAVGGVAVSPLDPNIVVIGTGEATNNIDRVGGIGILRSTDAGATWNPTSLNYVISSGHGFHVIRANPLTGTMLAGATDGVWRSSDSGATWTNVRPTDLNDYYDFQWRPGDANVVYGAKGSAASGNSVKLSTDDGLTWTAAGTGQPLSFNVGKTKLGVSPAQPDWVYAVYVNKGSGQTEGVYRSTDVGATWTAQNTVTNMTAVQGWYNLSMAVDPDNASNVVVGGTPVFRSTNNGVTFSQVNGPHVDHHAIAYEPGSTSNLWVGTDGGIWKSTNDGASYPFNLNNGLVTYQFYDICVNNNNASPYYVMGGTQDNGTDKWSGTTTWADGLGGDGMVCNISPNTGTTVYAESQQGNHARSTSSGAGGTFFSINTGITGTGAWVTAVAERADPSNNLFTATNVGTFRTLNGGSNWSQVDSRQASWIDVSEANGDYVWKLSGNPMYSTDNGTTWTDAAAYGFITAGATKILAHPTDVNTAFVSFGGYGSTAKLARTTDLGATWQDVTGDLPFQPCNAVEVNPSNINQWFLGTDTGVWASENGGVNWVPFEDGLPNAVVHDLEIQNNLQKLVAGTHGRGAWEVDIPPTIVGTDAPVVAAPTFRNLMLDSPFPNPAKDRAMLRFAAKSDAKVSLVVYDVQGRVVSDLAGFPNGDGFIRTTPWFTDDVPSGVYFAVLRAGAESISRKIVVAK